MIAAAADIVILFIAYEILDAPPNALTAYPDTAPVAEQDIKYNAFVLSVVPIRISNIRVLLLSVYCLLASCSIAIRKNEISDKLLIIVEHHTTDRRVS